MKRAPELNGFLGEGTLFEGDLRFPDTLRIEGTFRGRIQSPDATLIIAEAGQVEADVEVAELYVAGSVSGTVRASRRLEVSPHGRIVGEVFSRNLIVRDGALIEGECHMEDTPEVPGAPEAGSREPEEGEEEEWGLFGRRGERPDEEEQAGAGAESGGGPSSATEQGEDGPGTEAAAAEGETSENGEPPDSSMEDEGDVRGNLRAREEDEEVPARPAESEEGDSGTRPAVWRRPGWSGKSGAPADSPAGSKPAKEDSEQ